MSGSLLLVEDNDQDEKLILRVLRKVNLGNQVEVVRDGQQALDYLAGVGEYVHRAGAMLPAVVFLDISLPRVNGLEVLRRLRLEQRTRLLPIVMLTSSDDQLDRITSYINGANSFVRKPLDFEEFADAVGRLGVYWTSLNQSPHS
jgi:CheY-like chemotaxis protein